MREDEVFRVTDASGRVWALGERWPDRADGELGVLRLFEAKVRKILEEAKEKEQMPLAQAIARALTEIGKSTLPMRIVKMEYADLAAEGEGSGSSTFPAIEVYGVPDEGTDFVRENRALRATLFLNGAFMEELVDLQEFIKSLKG